MQNVAYKLEPNTKHDSARKYLWSFEIYFPDEEFACLCFNSSMLDPISIQIFYLLLYLEYIFQLWACTYYNYPRVWLTSKISHDTCSWLA